MYFRNRQLKIVLFHIENIKAIQIKPLSRLFCSLSSCLTFFDHRHHVDWCIYDRGPEFDLVEFFIEGSVFIVFDEGVCNFWSCLYIRLGRVGWVG